MAAAKLPKKERTQMDDYRTADAGFYERDEIHRLRADIANKQSIIDSAMQVLRERDADLARLTEENARLREALQDMLDVFHDGTRSGYPLKSCERAAALVKGEA